MNRKLTAAGQRSALSPFVLSKGVVTRVLSFVCRYVFQHAMCSDQVAKKKQLLAWQRAIMGCLQTLRRYHAS